MSELITTLGVKQISAKAKSGTAFATRGLRGSLQSDGTYDLSAIADVGQIVSDVPTSAAGSVFLGAVINTSITIPAVVAAGISPAVGDTAYTAAAGTFSNVINTSGVLIGTWKQIAAAGAVGEIIING